MNKTILLCIFTVLLNSNEGLAQWFKQDVPTTQDLRDVHFVNQSVGWVVGDGGSILHTTNGGSLWNVQECGDTTQSLFSVFGLDETTCWAVGESLVVKTTNGGTTWSKVNLNVHFFDRWIKSSVIFTDKDTGWIAGWYLGTPPGDSSFILKTVDGGMSWTKQYLPNQFCVPYKLVALDGRHAWLLCAELVLGTNNGSDWRIVAYGGTQSFINDVDFVTPETGWLAVNQIGIDDLFHTIDSGKTWTFQRSVSPVMYISFIDTLRGWVVDEVGWTDSIQIWHTTSGGVDWDKQFEYPSSPEHLYPNRIRFMDSLNGWMVGTKGMVFHTSNGGVTGVNVAEGLLPNEYSLSQNYPNPFNPSTTISYALPVRSLVTLKVFNLLGQEVAALVDGVEAPGYRSVSFDGGKLSSGVYFYKLQAGNYSAVKKLMFLK